MSVEKLNNLSPETRYEREIAELLHDLGSNWMVEGESGRKVSGVASLREAKESDLTFCSLDGDSALYAITQSNAGIIMCKKGLKGLVTPKKGTQLIFLDNPRLVFVRFVNELQRRIQEKKKRTNSSNVSPTAIIAENAKIGRNCTIGNYVVIGEGCIIGDNTIIHDRATLAQNCRLGRNCVIQSGVTLGEDGFAYERHQDMDLEKFPHFKGVVIGDNVEICANTNIARGSLTDTVIGSGTKIDAMVHIAHNTKVGNNCQLTAGTVIGGSASVGDCCWTGLNCTIKDHVKLGMNVIVGAGACVIRDVVDGDVVAGVPAKSIKEKISESNVFLMAGQEKTR